MQRLGYFQSALQVLPSPLVHREESRALAMGDTQHFKILEASVTRFGPPTPTLHGAAWCCECLLHLVLIEVCNDDTHKQSESNHASQKHKDVDVDAVDLQAQKVFKLSRCSYAGEEVGGKVKCGSVPVQHGE